MNVDFTLVSTSVPEPSAVFLLSIGLILLSVSMRRMRCFHRDNL